MTSFTSRIPLLKAHLYFLLQENEISVSRVRGEHLLPRNIGCRTASPVCGAGENGAWLNVRAGGRKAAAAEGGRLLSVSSTTQLLQSGHQFCIGVECSATASASIRAEASPLSASLFTAEHGEQLASRSTTEWWGAIRAVSIGMSASDSSAALLSCKVGIVCFLSPSLALYLCHSLSLSCSLTDFLWRAPSLLHFHSMWFCNQSVLLWWSEWILHAFCLGQSLLISSCKPFLWINYSREEM